MRIRPGICLMLLLTAGAVRAQDQAPPPVAEPVALLVFLDGRPQPQVPVAVGELRETVTGACVAALSAQGVRTLPTADLAGPLLRWRVRTDLNIGDGFLRDCADSLGVRELIVTNLVSKNGLLLLMMRRLDCRNGRLIAVAVGERDLWNLDPGSLGDLHWERELRFLMSRTVLELFTAQGLVQAPEPAAGSATGKMLLMLPVNGFGTTTDANTAATHILLQYLANSGRAQLADPSLVGAALLEAGLHPTWVGSAARRLLEKRFGARHIVVPELISYDITQAGSMPAITDDEAAPQRLAVRDFSLVIRVVDLRTGAVVASEDVFIDTAGRTGWFGHVSRPSLLEHLQKSAATLWKSVILQLEAS